MGGSFACKANMHDVIYTSDIVHSSQQAEMLHQHSIVIILLRFGLRKYRKVRGSWKARESLSTIIVHKDMLLDHAPHRVTSLLERFDQHPDFSVPLETSSPIGLDEADGLRRGTA